MMNKTILLKAATQNVGAHKIKRTRTNSVSASKRHPLIQSENPKKECNPINTALAHFDALPDSAFVRQPVVLGLFACSKATLWRWVKIARVPSPQKMGIRISAWNVGELRHSLSQLKSSEK